MAKIALSLAVAGIFLAAACSGGLAQPERITVMAYNVGSLFDAKDDGGEYPEFSVKAGTWDAERYAIRLGRLAEVALRAVSDGPDVIALAEIENAGVLDDLVSGGLKGKGYRWTVAAPDDGSAIRCGIVSKLPIRSAKAHRASGPTVSGRAPRLVLEVELDSRGRKLYLLASHWKSKVEGAAATEPERIAQAAVVAERVRAILDDDPAADLAVVGDLNENPDEYEQVGRAYPVALMPFGGAAPAPGLFIAAERDDAGPGPDGVALWSPWFETEGWSYSYRGKEERIDHALLAPGLFDPAGFAYAGFRVVAPDFLFGADGLPAGWDNRTGGGYSDHLPVVLELTLCGEESAVIASRR
ncbi:MAG: endonuclease/exonuclease/phosphatase family protein [Spirochaetes bacterium]|nr:endonuclease/exonuclease/phosphatase family protein [Spirochaetota bacterium]